MQELVVRGRSSGSCGVSVGRQGLSLKQQGKIYQCCGRLVFLYCCETWKRSVADEIRLRGVQRCMIWMMCGVRLVDRLLTDVLHSRVGIVVKIQDMIIQSSLQSYGHQFSNM